VAGGATVSIEVGRSAAITGAGLAGGESGSSQKSFQVFAI